MTKARKLLRASPFKRVASARKYIEWAEDQLELSIYEETKLILARAVVRADARYRINKRLRQTLKARATR